MLNDIMKNKLHCAFVSPHYDDAVFSAGGLISKLVESGCKVTVINVFTNPPEQKNTLSAKAYLKQCGFKDASALYKVRFAEDKNTLENLGCNVINLGHTEALWRQKHASGILKKLGDIIPELNALYPTYRFNISKGKIHKTDQTLVRSIADTLSALTRELRFDTIFAPFGTGNHVDHIVVNEAVKSLNTKCLFWEDFPYSMYEKSNVGGYEIEEITPNWDEKLKYMKMYSSQFDAVFKQIPPSKQERYFYK